MEQESQKNQWTLSLVQCMIFGVVFVPLLYYTVFGPRGIHEAKMHLDFFQCSVFMFLYLCSNSAFLLLLCNVIIGALMVLGKSSESHDIYSSYLKESEGMRSKQVAVADPSGIEKNGEILSECTEICCAENVRKPGLECGDCCSEKTKSMWVSSSNSSSSSSMAVVPYAEISNEELNRKCDEFIAGFHGFYRPYINQSEGGKKQEVVAEPLRIGKKSYIHEHGAADTNVRKLGIGCGDCSSEETKSTMWVSFSSSSSSSSMADTDMSNEELKRKCDEFIAGFRRQISLQSRST